MVVVNSNTEEPIDSINHKSVTITPSSTSKQDELSDPSDIKNFEDILEDLGTILSFFKFKY